MDPLVQPRFCAMEASPVSPAARSSASGFASPKKNRSVRLSPEATESADVAEAKEEFPVLLTTQRRRMRHKTRPGEFFQRYPRWFCSSDCGPKCCGILPDALKDSYYTPGSSPKSKGSTPSTVAKKSPAANDVTTAPFTVEQNLNPEDAEALSL